eukprot:10503097-Karenia_brevis.AAC.1
MGPDDNVEKDRRELLRRGPHPDMLMERKRLLSEMRLWMNYLRHQDIKELMKCAQFAQCHSSIENG